MKKLIAALFAAVLMAAGLVVATGSTASANCDPTHYAGCVPTKTKITAPGAVPKGKKATLCVTVKAKGSNATPTGKVVIKLKRNQGGYFFKSSGAYSGGEVCVKSGKLNAKGGYTATAKFKSPAGSVFQNSSGSVGFDVV